MSQNSSFEWEDIKIEFFKFPGGEVHFKIDPEFKNLYKQIKIIADLHNSEEVMKMMLVADFFSGSEIVLDIMYLPYARQDRVTAYNEPFSLKTICKMINLCEFERVYLNDPHSDVSPALIDRCVVNKRVELVRQTNLECLDSSKIIVSPDAGAMKANHEIAMKYGCRHITATKVRDLKTGQITKTELHTDIDLTGKSLIIFDDICDGGRTFIELAKVLRTHNPSNIHLHVTTGIFSNGMDELNKYIDDITYFHKLGEK
jgi:ribose-phosphate pyrophosphokinase